MLRHTAFFALLFATASSLMVGSPALQPSLASISMRDPDSRSASREKLLPDILNALNDVSVFIAKADASRMRKPEAPSAECIEQYCARQQKKIDLLQAEAKLLREADAAAGGSSKVRWTDIDGNEATDAAWLK